MVASFASPERRRWGTRTFRSVGGGADGAVVLGIGGADVAVRLDGADGSVVAGLGGFGAGFVAADALKELEKKE